MKINLFVEIKGEIDSLMLWELIKEYKLNLTDVITKTWVYGETDYMTAGKVISKCALFGDLTAEIHKGGGKDEPKETEETQP